MNIDSFNTSYVSVQVKRQFIVYLQEDCFNTSYVSVQVISLNIVMLVKVRFNTSYVSVQEAISTTTNSSNSVSIHPMFRFKML